MKSIQRIGVVFLSFFFSISHTILPHITNRCFYVCWEWKKKIEKKTAQLSKNGRLWIDIHTPDCADLHTFDSAKFKHRLYLFGRKARIFLIWFGIFTWFSLKYTHEMKKKSARVVPLKIQSWALLFKKKTKIEYIWFSMDSTWGNTNWTRSKYILAEKNPLWKLLGYFSTRRFTKYHFSQIRLDNSIFNKYLRNWSNPILKIFDRYFYCFWIKLSFELAIGSSFSFLIAIFS